MDYFALAVLLAGVIFGFLKRGKEDRVKILEVVTIALMLGLISAYALSHLILEDVGLGELVRTFGIVVSAIFYTIAFVIGTFIGDFLERFRK